MILDRYAILANALVVARDCIGITDCEFDTFVSLGDPPQECSQLTGRYLREDVRPAIEGDRCRQTLSPEFEIIFNRCCLTNNPEDFSPSLEDDDARCFMDDFGTLLECLVCYLGQQLPQDVACKNQYVRASTVDDVSQGGCYTGRIRFGFDVMISCCEIPNPV